LELFRAGLAVEQLLPLAVDFHLDLFDDMLVAGFEEVRETPLALEPVDCWPFIPARMVISLLSEPTATAKLRKGC